MEALEDPYSNYMGKETAPSLKSIEGSFSGIGAEVSSVDGSVVVVSPIKGSPADKAGIRAKDTILSVNGESLQGLELNAAVNKIRGPKGSKAVLQIKRAGSGDRSSMLSFVMTSIWKPYRHGWRRAESALLRSPNSR